MIRATVQVAFNTQNEKIRVDFLTFSAALGKTRTSSVLRSLARKFVRFVGKKNNSWPPKKNRGQVEAFLNFLPSPTYDNGRFVMIIRIFFRTLQSETKMPRKQPCFCLFVFATRGVFGEEMQSVASLFY